MTVAKQSTFVALIPGKEPPFRRSVRDDKGNAIKVLIFGADAPIEITTQEEAEAISKDVGRVLCIVGPPNKDGQHEVDWDRTWEIHERVHGTGKPEDFRVSSKINAGLGANKSFIIDKATKKSDPNEVVISDGLAAFLEDHRELFGATEPDANLPALVDEFVLAGNDLGKLEDFTPTMATELLQVLAQSRDMSKLIAAGIDDKVALALSSNVKSIDDRWLLDPVAIKVKVDAGFDLEGLSSIGRAAVKKIKTAIANLK